MHIARGLTPAQARAYRLMDNRASENAEWDERLLGLELDDLQLDGFDLSLTGFDDDELAAAAAPGRHRRPRRRGRHPRDAGAPGHACPAISGSSARTGCSAATPRLRPTSRACSTA